MKDTESLQKQLTYSPKDFANNQSVRWCPGCGDYAILAAVMQTLPQLNIPKEDIVFVSGIGCAARFPYYVDTYGFHTIHGRGPAIATGIKLANPKLSVWEVQGDGDALAIGGNHFIHAIRRDIDINILLFNNEIYGLTKGQSSPTSTRGLITRSTPYGVEERPFHVGNLVLGAQGSFYARTIDTNPKLMTRVFLEAANHKGTSAVEILQHCVIFNKGAHDAVTAKENRHDFQLHLEQGKPLLFGKDKQKGIRLNGLSLEVVVLGENDISEKDILVHDAYTKDPTLHMLLARMAPPLFPLALGVIRAVKSVEKGKGATITSDIKKTTSYRTVDELMKSGETWLVA